MTIPIVLGAVGHRILPREQEQELRRSIAAILQKLHEDYPATPLVLLSSLAPGADQLAADEAIDWGRRTNADVRVIAPLPFPPEVYLESTSFQPKDPANEGGKKYLAEARGRFTQFLNDQDHVTAFVVPFGDMPAGPDAWKALLQNPDAQRGCFANAGGYVVLHCHALIALWDGEQPCKPAGTAEMVQFKRTGLPPASYEWDHSLFPWADAGKVFVIHTPRDGQPTGRAPGEPYPLYPPRPGSPAGHPETPKQQKKRERRHKEKEEGRFAESCREIDRFNQNYDGLGTAAPDAAILEKMLGENHATLAVDGNLLPGARVREGASSLATSGSTRVEWLFVGVFALIFLAALCFHVYAHWVRPQETHEPAYLAAFLGLLICAGVVALRVRLSGIENETLDYRSVSEALRVQFYWGVAGVGESVARHYLEQVLSEMAWARRAVRACLPRPWECRQFFEALRADLQRDLLKAVDRKWVLGQIIFLHDRARKNERRGRRGRWAGLGLAFAGWAIALLFLVVPWLWPVRTTGEAAPGTGATFSEKQSNPDEEASNPYRFDASHPGYRLIILSGILVVAGGLFIAYSEHRLSEELAHQYEHMRVVFEHGHQAFDHLMNNDQTPWERKKAQVQSLFLELGREALSENSQWLILRRTRRFKLPLG